MENPWNEPGILDLAVQGLIEDPEMVRVLVETLVAARCSENPGSDMAWEFDGFGLATIRRPIGGRKRIVEPLPREIPRAFDFEVAITENGRTRHLSYSVSEPSGGDTMVGKDLLYPVMSPVAASAMTARLSEELRAKYDVAHARLGDRKNYGAAVEQFAAMLVASGETPTRVARYLNTVDLPTVRNRRWVASSVSSAVEKYGKPVKP